MKWLHERRPLCWLSPFVLAAVCCSSTLADDQAKPLDEQLFEDLNDDLFSDLAPIEDNRESKSDVDQQLQRELGGEDLGQRRQKHPLDEVAETMKRVRDRLHDRDLAAETQQMQARIVRDFDQLIEQLRNQQPQGGGGKNDDQKQQSQADRGKPKGQPPQGRSQGNSARSDSNNPAGVSTTRLGQAETAEADAATRDRMMQESWGNLPSAVRQQMQSARPEKFLPKYSRLIEDYFKRLSEAKDR